MFKIRFQPTRSSSTTFYNIVLISALKKQTGKFTLKLGSYNKLKKVVKLDFNLLHKYINLGAYPTDSLRHCLKRLILPKV